MKKYILMYALSFALLVICLQFLEYKLWTHAMNRDVYTSIIALLFLGLGIYLSSIVFKNKHQSTATELPLAEQIISAQHIDLSARELEVLQLMSKGCSNKEIAEKLFVSLNTIKTHTSNIYLKLEVGNRTQAIVKARELGVL